VGTDDSLQVAANSPLFIKRVTLVPKTEVILYRENDDSEPLITSWLEKLPAKATAKCLKWLELLEENGIELRRPLADFLRDDIYELRIKFGSLNYRILYFFHGERVAVASHGCTKERTVPPAEIDKAIAHMTKFNANPDRHGFRGPIRGAPK
jgi:hypothetical protein